MIVAGFLPLIDFLLVGVMVVGVIYCVKGFGIVLGQSIAWGGRKLSTRRARRREFADWKASVEARLSELENK